MLAALEQLHFIRPLWLLTLIPVLWLLWLLYQRHKNSNGWNDAIDADLLAVQMREAGKQSHGWYLGTLAIGLLLSVLALAGPAWQKLPQPLEQKSDALVIVLDLSLSMFADDIAPSRLVRARQKITDVLRARHEGFTALIAYAGDAHAVSPLTDDTKTIENLLSALSPAMMPALGSNVEEAIELAKTLFENSAITEGRMLLVTDGVDSINSVTRHKDPAFPISILGLGTAEGSEIPLDFVNQPGRKLQDNEGDLVIAKLDEDRLRTIAEICHGTYATLRLDSGDLATVLPEAEVDDEATLSDRRFDAWADVGPYLVLALLPLVVFAFRRGALALVLLCLLPLPSEASLWDDLWQRRDQQGHKALTRGEPEVAADLFKDPDWQASADYRSGNYQSAAEHFANTPTADGFYNLGNTLARQGQVDAAIEAYERTLELEPEHADALFNKDLLEQAKQQSESEDSQSEQQEDNENSESEQNQEQQSSDQESSEDDSQDEADSAEQEQEEQEAQQQPSEEQDEQTGEEQQAQAQQEPDDATDEERAAMEQWLRRVPDDPGGLLRRKFEYETKQRLRRGEYRPKTEKIW